MTAGTPGGDPPQTFKADLAGELRHLHSQGKLPKGETSINFGKPYPGGRQICRACGIIFSLSRRKATQIKLRG